MMPYMRQKGAKNRQKTKAEEVRKWFLEHVSYEGEPYIIDLEQAEAVADESRNAIVVARAGSGKTRTIVAKMVYLIAQKSVKPEEIMAFVFNANAAAEINARLSNMMVDGVSVTGGAKVASTFHAFARRIVFDVCGGREKCGEILAGEKEMYIAAIVGRMMKEERWRKKIVQFVTGAEKEPRAEIAGERGQVVVGVGSSLTGKEMTRFAKMMTTFVNRAQQKFLGGEVTLTKSTKVYLKQKGLEKRERLFVELGVECFRRYHWYLLDAEHGLLGFNEFGTDFNLIVSWAAKLIMAGKGGVRDLLAAKKHILIDEYQDFSELFLSVVRAILTVATEARVFVVGDDWQAINRFAGSEVEYFKEFEKYFEGARRMEIRTNYRCDMRVVETARKFMTGAMGEKGEFRAFSKRAGKVVVVNPDGCEVNVPMTPWDMRISAKDRLYAEMARKITGVEPKLLVVQYVKKLVEVISRNRKAESIMILHRNNETDALDASLTRVRMGLLWGLMRLGVMSVREFETKVRVMTMHKSKGLEAEVVIILEADAGVIPRVHPDTMLYGVFGETEEVALDDQKRLFYVAMTRAKRRLYIMHRGSCRGEKAGFIRYLGRGVEKM